MNTSVREGETIEESRTMRNRPYQVLKCSSCKRSVVQNPPKTRGAQNYRYQNRCHGQLGTIYSKKVT